MKRAFAMVIAVLLLLTVVPLPAQANSGPSRWQGTNSSGIVVTGENCPIVVEHEDLVFDLTEFPLEHYPSQLSYQNYSGKVTAEYTFFNPTDQEVEVTLVFPFGMEPDYAYYDFDAPGKHYDWEKYGVSVDGQPIDAAVRHTLAYHGQDFDMEDLELLHDGFLEDEFYRPDLPVRKYVFQFSGVDLEEHHAAYAGIDLNCDPAKTRVWLSGCNGGDTHDGFVRVGLFLERYAENNSVELYVMGEPLETMPEWKVYENGAMETEIEGTAAVVDTEEMTLYDMVMVRHYDWSEVQEHDWYNALITAMKQNEWSYGFVMEPYLDAGRSFDASRNLMRWYEYTLTFQPGERLVNTVTAPLYPDIEMDYEPFRYSYTYLLSPAALWADFGTLDITVNTPFYMVEATNVTFEWDNPGYSAHLDGLPEGELEFTLSQSQNPSSTVKTMQQIYQGLSGNAVFLMVILLAAFLFGFAVWKLFVRKHIHLD